MANQLDPFEAYEKEVRELRAVNVVLAERLMSTNATIADHLDGTWDGNEEGWRLVIDNNRAAILQSVEGAAS
jgi:hypothetical protein